MVTSKIHCDITNRQIISKIDSLGRGDSASYLKLHRCYQASIALAGETDLIHITPPARVNGIETLKGLMAEHPSANVVIVSAVGQKQIVFEALGMGAKDFIVKPFDPDRVMKAVRRLFAA